ncbi:MAG: hypothetical protein M1361_01000 [Patescibacteria group bacterium]|nr:hypothetical protein [Patescibacteria group bacterium]MCL5224181.1 hypothetical protein [Patescibacteria group bacterium]
MNTLKKWLSGRHTTVTMAKVGIIAYLTGVFTKNLLVKYIIGSKAYEAVFGNGHNLAILLVAIAITIFIARKWTAKNSDNRSMSLAPHSN